MTVFPYIELSLSVKSRKRAVIGSRKSENSITVFAKRRYMVLGPDLM